MRVEEGETAWALLEDNGIDSHLSLSRGSVCQCVNVDEMDRMR